MTPASHSSGWSQRLGRACALILRGWMRFEHAARRGLMELGLPAAVAKAIAWIPKLLLLGVLLYAAFWTAVFLLLIAAGIVLVSNISLSDLADRGEWRHGHEGWGYYVDDHMVHTDQRRPFHNE